MRRHSFLAVALGAMTSVLLLASRCSDDDDKKGPSPAAAEVPVDGAVSDSELGKVDGGVDKDPLDGAMGGDAPLAEPGDAPPQSGDSLQDDQTFEPQPVPEDTKGL